MTGLPTLVLFTSEESHYSFQKAANWLGLGMDNCVAVKTNELGQMLIEDLEQQILKAKTLGKEPFFVNATAGTTVLGAFDDFNAVADVCEKYGLWMHVDVSGIQLEQTLINFPIFSGLLGRFRHAELSTSSFAGRSGTFQFLRLESTQNSGRSTAMRFVFDKRAGATLTVQLLAGELSVSTGQVL